MFKKYKNYEDANTILKLFEPIFKSSAYEETFCDDFNGYTSTKYIAKSHDNWELVTHFYGKKQSGVIKKDFYPYISFEKDTKKKLTHFTKDSVAERNQQSVDIANFLEKQYQPDFDKVFSVLDIFIEQGLNSGMFKAVNVKRYKRHMTSHMHINHYHGTICLWDKNYSSITFNNILQKGAGKNGTHFKKSFISVGVIHLVDSNNDVKPYFKIKLPTSATNKNTYVIPISDQDTLYLVGDDDSLRYTPIDKIISMPLKKEKLAEYFKGEIENEIKTTISKTLKIKKTELDNLSADELKDYFMLVEMIKI
jgi:hypothetical protein